MTLTCLSSCFLFPASGNATLTARGVWEGLECIDQRRPEGAPSMWLRKSPHRCWVDILVWAFRRAAPTTLQVTLTQLMGSPE